MITLSKKDLVELLMGPLGFIAIGLIWFYLRFDPSGFAFMLEVIPASFMGGVVFSVLLVWTRRRKDWKEPGAPGDL